MSEDLNWIRKLVDASIRAQNMPLVEREAEVIAIKKKVEAMMDALAEADITTEEWEAVDCMACNMSAIGLTNILPKMVMFEHFDELKDFIMALALLGFHMGKSGERFHGI